MTAITRAVSIRLWISVFLIELFGVGLACLIAAWMLPSRMLKLAGLGGGAALIALGLLLLVPPVYRRVKGHETFFRLASTVPLWLLLALGGVELVLHLAVYHSPLRYAETHYMGKQPLPGSVMLSGREGYGITHYGAGGEIGGTSGESDGDVIVLGDSFTEAMQVMDNEKYTTIAEKQLQQGGLSIRVHNLGNSGACLSDYTYFAQNARQLQPALHTEFLVLQVSKNDLNDNPFEKTRNNYFTIEPDGSFTVHHNNAVGNNAETAEQQLARLSSIVKLLRMRLYPADAPRTQMDVGFDRQLAALRKATAGFKVIILALPDVPIIENNRLTMEDPAYDQLVAMLKAIPEWQVIDPLPAFQDLALQGHLPRGFGNSLPGVGHMNAWGHAVVGRLLAEKIAAMEQQE